MSDLTPMRAEAMSKHTDAARLEATRDAIRTGTAPRPRVEGDRVRLLAEEHPGHIGLKTIRDLALDLLDERAAVARLTAEVERLTKEKAASGETKISAEHLDALARYARDEISTGRLAELLGVTLMDLLDLRNAVQSDAPPAPEGEANG